MGELSRVERGERRVWNGGRGEEGEESVELARMQGREVEGEEGCVTEVVELRYLRSH
jgi:hypothetical protein